MTETSTASLPADANETAPGAPAPTTQSSRRRSGGGLNGMVLAELQQVAGGLGIKGTARMRKSQLIDAITAAQSGSQAQGATGNGNPATQGTSAPEPAQNAA